MKHLLAITIALLPLAVMAEQFTPQQMLEVMTKSPENRDVRVHDDDCKPWKPYDYGAAAMRDLFTNRQEETTLCG